MLTPNKETHGKRILVVEDDALDYAYVEHCLTEWTAEGIEIVWAPTVEEADQLLRQSEFDVVLLDYHVGSRTPGALVRHLRGPDHHVPVMVLSNQFPATLEPFLEAMDDTVFVDKTLMTSGSFRQGMAALGLALNS